MTSLWASMPLSFDDVIMSFNEWPKLRWPEACPRFSFTETETGKIAIFQIPSSPTPRDATTSTSTSLTTTLTHAMRCRRCVRTQNFASIRRLQEHACKYIRVGSRVLDSLVVFWRVFRAGTKKVGKKFRKFVSRQLFCCFFEPIPDRKCGCKNR